MQEQSVNKGLLLTAHDGYWNLLYKEVYYMYDVEAFVTINKQMLTKCKSQQTRPVLLNTLSNLVFINVT